MIMTMTLESLLSPCILALLFFCVFVDLLFWVIIFELSIREDFSSGLLNEIIVSPTLPPASPGGLGTCYQSGQGAGCLIQGDLRVGRGVAMV